MASLLEKLQQNIQLLGAGDKTLQARNQLAALSGKATGGPPGAMSTQAEKAATAGANAQLLEAQTQADTQTAQVQQQQQKQTQAFEQEKKQLDLRQQQQEQQRQIQTDQLLQDLEQNRAAISVDKQRAALEQVASNMALQDRKYLDELRREGERRRLDNANAFKIEQTRAILGNNEQLLRKALGDKDLLATDEREFRRQMGRMDLDTALSMARNELATAKETGKWRGIGGLITGGIAAAGAAGKSNALANEEAQDLAVSETNNPSSDVNLMKARK